MFETIDATRVCFLVTGVNIHTFKMYLKTETGLISNHPLLLFDSSMTNMNDCTAGTTGDY